MSTFDDIHLEQASWNTGWRKTPLLIRLLGGPKQHYRDSPRDHTYRMCWGELTLRWTGLALQVGAYDTAHLHISLLFFSAFIRLPFLDEALTTGPCGIENPRFGFTTFDGGVHLNWARATKILRPPWQPWWGICEFLAHDGRWLPSDDRARSWSPGEGVEPLKQEAPYHYLLDNGEVQHVTATITRERTWPTWQWFGTSGRVRKAPVSDFLRRVQKRLREPKQYIDISFSGEVGERAGSWKGGTTGCSYEMKPGETPTHTLRRMQRERRFR